MGIKVRFFASLREQLGCAESELELPAPATVDDVWRAVSGGRPLPENVLAAVNQDYAEPEGAVGDGDEVAFFPPVTGG